MTPGDHDLVTDDDADDGRHVVLVASDLPSLRRSLRATLEAPTVEVLEAATGTEAVALAVDEEVDLLVADLQIGAMGAVAIVAELRNLASTGDALPVPCLLLLDRRPDVFLARRVGAEGYLVKPLEPVKLRRAVRAVLEGGRFEDDAWRPVTVRAAALSSDG